MMAGISVDFQSILAIFLASLPIILTVLLSMWQHNKRVDDSREILQAEIKSSFNETLVCIEAVKQRIEIISTKMTSLEEDVKRSLNGIEKLHINSNEFVRTATEHRLKLESIKDEAQEQKMHNSEIKEELIKTMKTTASVEKSIDQILKSFELRLNEIEKKYIDALNEFSEKVIKKLDK